MINFNAGALRPAGDDARATRIAAANDLVRRTLAQHGLAPGGGDSAARRPGGADSMSIIQAALSRAAFRASSAPADAGAAFDDATLRRDTFKGRSGGRNYRTYVPASAAQGVTGIVMMLHGCTQNPEDFAVGTGMNALADEGRFVVIYPEQSRGANAQSCWNWFGEGDQRRDRGEPEILAGIARLVMAEHDVPRDRTFVAGLSAGAAMAVILGETYPDIFAAVGAHSGLPFCAAHDVRTAFAAMAGKTSDGSAPAPRKSDLRTIVFHGAADSTVHPSNGEAIVKRADLRGGAETLLTVERGETKGRSFQRSLTSGADGAIQSEHWVIDGLGHAWSGGSAGGSYIDPAGPDASGEMIRFFFGSAQRSV